MFFGVTSAHWPCGDRVLITCCSVLDGCWYGTKTKHSPWFYKKNTQYNVINKHTKDKNQKKTKYKQLFFRLDMQCFQKSILFFKIAPYHIDWFSKKFHSNKVWQQFFVFVLQTSSEVVWILWNGTHDIALSQHLTFDNYSTHNFLFLAVRVFDWPIIPETESELFVTKYIYWSYLQKCRWQ